MGRAERFQFIQDELRLGTACVHIYQRKYPLCVSRKCIWRKGQNVVERRSGVAKHSVGSPTGWFTHNTIRTTAASVAKFGTVTLTAAPSWRKLASAAKLLCLSNLKVEAPKKKKKKQSWKWDSSHHCREQLMRVWSVSEPGQQPSATPLWWVENTLPLTSLLWCQRFDTHAQVRPSFPTSGVLNDHP